MASPEASAVSLAAPPIAPPGTPQLTLRAALTGMVLGGVLSLSNLYSALKIGTSFGVAITAGILAFGVFTAFRALFPKWAGNEFGVLENNAMQSVASAAGYMTGGGTVAAIPALMMLTGEPLPIWQMFPWVMVLALVGVVMAIPMKRQMINIEQLRFPSGIAAAETLRGLHADGATGTDKARILGWAGAFGALWVWMRDAKTSWMPFNLPEKLEIPRWTVGGRPATDYTLHFDSGVLMVGAGALIGMRVAISQLIGAVANYAILAPRMVEQGVIQKVSYKGIVTWSVWGGSSMLLTAGLLAFAFQWRTVGRAITSMGSAVKGRTDAVIDAWEAHEVPMPWFVTGMVILTPLAILLQWWFFDIAPWMGLLAVILAFFIALVAARATGETDTTPTGALGKITQLTFGVLDPGNVQTNLMTANVTGGAAIHCADLLTDLKSGYLLGANPRQQFLAQFLGVLAGSLFVVPAYHLLVPTPESIGTDKFPAPAAQSWAAVAQLLAKGLDTLHPTARWAILIGGGIGILLVLLERSFPRHKKWIPSPMGLGLAFTMPGSNSLSMFIGALAAWILEKRNPVQAERLVVPVSSGLIAGESILGIFIAILVVMGFLAG